MNETKEKLIKIVHDTVVCALGSAQAKACSERIVEAIILSGILEDRKDGCKH